MSADHFGLIVKASRGVPEPIVRLTAHSAPPSEMSRCLGLTR